MAKEPTIIEQVSLDEISKKTLGSYIRAAGPDREQKLQAARYASDAGHAERRAGKPNKANDHFMKSIHLATKATNRKAGINKAVDKLTKEDVEQVDEISKKTLGNYIRGAGGDRERKLTQATGISVDGHHMAAAGDHDRAQKNFQKAGELIGKAANRKAGINKAVDKLTKEDVEQVDEISNRTLGSYIKGANISAVGATAAMMNSKHGSDEQKKYTKQIGKRAKGIAKAVDRLTKDESTEWPVYARIMEKSKDPHTKGATEPEKIDANWSEGEKAFMNKHGGVDGNPAPAFADDKKVDANTSSATAKIKKSPLNQAPGSQ